MPTTIQVDAMGVSVSAGGAQMRLDTQAGVSVSFGASTLQMSPAVMQLGCGKSQLLVLTDLAAVRLAEMAGGQHHLLYDVECR